MSGGVAVSVALATSCPRPHQASGTGATLHKKEETMLRSTILTLALLLVCVSTATPQ